MAKKFKKGTTTEQQSELKAYVNAVVPQEFRQEFIDEISKNGNISDESLAKASMSNPGTVYNFRTEIQRITGGLTKQIPLTKAELKSELGADTVEADLTDKELAERREIYKELQGATEPLDRATIERELETKLKNYGVTPVSGADKRGKDFSEEAKRIITDKILETGRYPSAPELLQAIEPLRNKFKTTIHDKVNELFTPLVNFANDQAARNYLSDFVKNWKTSPDTTADVKRIEDIIAGRAKETKREGEISSFIESIPGELAGPTKERISLLRELGSKRFGEVAPQLIAREQALGRGSSGAVGDILASTYGDIQGGIESESARLMSEDEQFYANSAYQNQIRKMLEGRTDLATSVATERQGIRTQQEQRFQKGQFDLNANVANDLLMQRYENQIRAVQSARQRQQEAQGRARGAGFMGAAGGLAGTIAGGVIGGFFPGSLPIAAGIGLGAGIGGGIGTGLPLLFGSQ